MTNTPDFVIPGDLAQTIADYLATRPYREVAAMIQALQRMKPAPNMTNLSQPIHSVAESHATE